MANTCSPSFPKETCAVQLLETKVTCEIQSFDKVIIFLLKQNLPVKADELHLSCERQGCCATGRQANTPVIKQAQSHINDV